MAETTDAAVETIVVGEGVHDGGSVVHAQHGRHAAPVAQDHFTAMIERVLVDPSVDLARLEKLMDLHDRVQARRAKAAFFADFSAMQPELPGVAQTGRIIVYSKADRERQPPNPNAKPIQETPYSSLADINEAIKGPLAKFGFALSFKTGIAPDGRITVTGILGHREGHEEQTTMVLMHDSTGSKNPVQAMGSSITYGKRYTASLLLNITSRAPTDGDDDGRAAGSEAGSIEEYLIDAAQLQTLADLLEATKSDRAAFCAAFEIPQISALPKESYDRAIALLNQKMKRAQGGK
jgi:hypothetical protein